MFLVDVTAAWVSDQGARELEQRYAHLTRHVSPISWTYDPVHPTREGLREWLAFTGQSSDDFVEEPLRPVHPEDVEYVRAALTHIEANGHALPLRCENKKS